MVAGRRQEVGRGSGERSDFPLHLSFAPTSSPSICNFNISRATRPADEIPQSIDQYGAEQLPYSVQRSSAPPAGSFSQPLLHAATPRSSSLLSRIHHQRAV